MFLHDDSVVIGDLGLGKRMEQVSVANTQVGTPLYFSPEVCREETYALSSDVWAFGCVSVSLVPIHIQLACEKEPVHSACTPSRACSIRATFPDHFQLFQTFGVVLVLDS